MFLLCVFLVISWCRMSFFLLIVLLVCWRSVVFFGLRRGFGVASSFFCESFVLFCLF